MNMLSDTPTSFRLRGLPFYGTVHHSGGDISWMEERLASGEIKRTPLMPDAILTTVRTEITDKR